MSKKRNFLFFKYCYLKKASPFSLFNQLMQPGFLKQMIIILRTFFFLMYFRQEDKVVPGE